MNEKIDIACEQLAQVIVALDCYRDALEMTYQEVINLRVSQAKAEKVRNTIAMSLEHAIAACNEIQSSLKQTKETLDAQPNLRDEFLTAWQRSNKRSWTKAERAGYTFGYIQKALEITDEELDEIDADDTAILRHGG